MQFDWEKLTKEEIDPLLSHINSEQFDELFKGSTSIEVMTSRLPFYNRFRLYRFTTFATMPSISLEFLGDGKTFYFLDGAPDPIYHTNHHDPIQLSKRNLLDYLVFFFQKVEGTDGDIQIITDPENSEYLTSVDDSFKKQVSAHYSNIDIEYQTDPERFIIVTPTFFEESIVEATMAVYPDGSLDLLEHKMMFGMFGGGMDWQNEIYT